MRFLPLVLVLAACSRGTPEHAGAGKSAASIRAQRRLYDGAPPVIPHADSSARCTSCHDERGVEVAGLGFAPPSPHEKTSGLSATSRCVQCHVFATSAAEFRGNAFVGLEQDLRHGDRLNALAPPVIPHRLFMRENCRACHTGSAAREEIRCSHPDRARCNQCHVPRSDVEPFVRG